MSPVKCLAAGILILAAACSPAPHHPLHHDGPPAITGNPAADPTLPPRFGHPGRLLMSCVAPAGRVWEVYASAQDFDEGRQSFFLKRTGPGEEETLYPLHGHFLNGGSSGIFMVHDGKGRRAGPDQPVLIDQSVNMGVLFFRTADGDVRAVLDVLAEDASGGTRPGALAESACQWRDAPRQPPDASHVRTQPNSGATPPSHWFRESNKTLLTCRGTASAGEFRFELLGATIWPGHLAFLVVHAPGADPVAYNVHLLARDGRLLIHTHSYPHRSRQLPFDTMEETETVIGGLLLDRTEDGYRGWAGLAASAADPYNISFSRDATLSDYAAQGRAVVPPTEITCR